MFLQALANVPHKNYYLKQMKSSESLQLVFDESSNNYTVWPTGVSFDKGDPSHIVIKKVIVVIAGGELTFTLNVNMNLGLIQSSN